MLLSPSWVGSYSLRLTEIVTSSSRLVFLEEGGEEEGEREGDRDRDREKDLDHDHFTTSYAGSC